LATIHASPCIASIDSETRPAHERERTQQPDQAAVVGDPEHVVVAQRHAEEQVAERDAEQERRAPTPLNVSKPSHVARQRSPGHLRAHAQAHRPHDQREQHQQHREVEARERRRVQERPRRERRAAS
jgi:hypothetical protein